MVAEQRDSIKSYIFCCSLAKISMVAELKYKSNLTDNGCSLAKISMVAEPVGKSRLFMFCCSLAKISMVAEPQNI